MLCSPQDQIINGEVRGKLEEILAPDYEVYNHFKSKFSARLESFGSGRMAEELGELRAANEVVMKKCDFSVTDNNKISGVNKWWGPANLVGYLVNIFQSELTSERAPRTCYQGRRGGGGGMQADGNV